MSKHFGAAVRARRKALKWTQKALAARVGCTDAYISEIENRRKEPGDELRARLIEVLELRGLPEEDTDSKVIAMPSPGVAPVHAGPSLELVEDEGFDEDGAPGLEGFTEALGQALARATITGWQPDGGDEARLGATLMPGAAGLGVLAQVLLSQPEHLPGAQARWALLKAPAPVDGAVGNGRLEKEYYLRRTLPDVPGFGPPPSLAYLPRELFPARARGLYRLPEQVAVLLFPITDQRLAHRAPRTLDQLDLMTWGVRSVRDLVNWCTLAHGLMSLVLNLHNAGWAHRNLSPATILVRTERGFHHAPTLIDFSAATPLNRPCPPFVEAAELWHWHPERIASWGHEGAPGAGRGRFQPNPRAEDLYALGAVLGHLLVGSSDRLSAPETGGEELRSWRVWRAQQKSEDLRFHINEGRKQPERLPEPLRAELTQLYHLCHELLDAAAPPDVERIFELLDTVDHIRTRGQLLLTDWPGRPLTAAGAGRRGPGSTEVLLRSMETHASTDQELQWCQRHRDEDVEAIKARIQSFPWLLRILQRLDTPCPPEALDVDRALADCMEFLRLGFVRYASQTLTTLLRLGPSDDPRRDVEMLRVVIGGLMLREADHEQAGRLLAIFDARDAPEADFIEHMGRRRWWVEVLKARLAMERGDRESVAWTLERLPRPEPETHAREWVWMTMLDALHGLERAQIPPSTREGLVMARRWTGSTPESLAVAMLLARCDATRGALGDALLWLHVGMGEASAREFPVEYAEMMALAARLLRDAMRRPDRRRRLHDQGDHPGALLEVAERLALRAGDMFQALGHHDRLQETLLVAGDCAGLRGSPRKLLRAATWYSLARGNAALERAGGSPHGREALARLTSLEEQWRAAPGAGADPGARQAATHLDQHGPVHLAMMGGMRIAPALVDRAHPALGALLGPLVEHFVTEAPQVIVEVGCGTGANARALSARFPEAEVIGVDVSTWAVREARRQRGPQTGGLAFHPLDLEAMMAGRVHFGSPDLVIMGDALRHVTFKGAFLETLRESVAPGGLLLCTDLVLQRPASPGLWRRVVDTGGWTCLETSAGLFELLEGAGFEVLNRRPEDLGPPLRELLRERLRWFEEGRDREARKLHERAGAAAFVKRELETMIEALGPQGPLGWIGLAARAR